MCACDYVKECGIVGHDRNELEIIATVTQRYIFGVVPNKKLMCCPHEFKQHHNHAFVVG